MARKRVLYITSHGATAYAVGNGRLSTEGEFSDDEAGMNAFMDYLHHERESLFYLLGDVPEEDFQQENIPYVTGADRAALITRKLVQTFRDTKLSLAISLGREAGGRRDERVLFAAFTNTQFFHPWLRALYAEEVRMAGVYSIALTANALFRKLGLKQAKLLIISVHRAGIRQNYFEDGRIRFSRLTPALDTDARRSAEACVVESGKILQYLEGLRLVPREGAPLEVLVFTPHDQYGVFSEVCTSTQRLIFDVVDEQTVAAKIGLKNLPAGSRAEALFCFLLGLRAPAQQYASKTQRRLYRLWQVRAALLLGSGAIFASCMLFAANQFFGILKLRSQVEMAEQQAKVDARRYDGVRQTFPATPTNTENLKATVKDFETLDRAAADPQVLLTQVSGVLSQFPQMEIDQLEWSVTRKPDEVGSAESLKTGAPQQPAPVALPFAQHDESEYQVAYLSGHIQLPNRIDYRGMLDYVDRFAEGLRKIPGTRVDLVKLPFDTRSGAKLSGGVTTDPTQQASLFAVRVSRKI
jgi:hypothetical protein